MKEELQEYLLQMTKPLKKHLSKEGAGLYLGAFAAGYGMEAAKIEGISRVLWGLTPFWAGGGKEEEYKTIYKRAIVNGTNPNHKEYWGDLSDRDQRMVEMAAISLNLLMTPDVIWNQLNEEEQKNLASWLYQINYYTCPDNNWNFFNVMVNVALKKCGMPYSEEGIQHGKDRYDSFYLGNGWYADGIRPQKDYYTSFGIHFYCLLYANYMEQDDPKTCRKYKERAKVFAESFIYWFDEEGKALPFGRSMTYRFAQVAFWSLFALVVGEECSYLGVVKGIIGRHFRYWMKQPILDNGNILTVGYCYPNLNIAENYNSPSSPYWAFKAFLCLAILDDNTFWAIKEEPLPKLLDVKRIEECDMLLLHKKGEVCALTAGQYPTIEHTHSPAKYAKFAYSSLFGFSVPKSTLTIEECAPDSMLAFYIHDMVYVRRKCMEYKISDTQVYAKWSPVKGIEVETILVPTKEGHTRKHRIVSEYDCIAYDCGFSYPAGKGSQLETGENYVKIYDDNGYSMVESPLGQGQVISAMPNTNLIFPLTKIPSMVYEIHKGEQHFTSEIIAQMSTGLIVVGKGDCYELQPE